MCYNSLVKLENDLIPAVFRFGFLLFFFNGFSQHRHPLIKFYNGDLKLNERQVDSLVTQTLYETDSEYLLALAFYQKGVLQRKIGEDVDAFKNYEQALAYLQSVDTTDNYLLSALWRNQGAILHNYKLHEEAVKLYEKALSPAYKYNINRGISTEYNIGLAMIQYDPKNALSLFLNLKSKVKEDFRRQARIYNQLGLFQKRTEQYDEAIAYYTKGLELGVSGRVKADLLQNISEAYYQKKEYLNQERFLLQTLQIPEANRFIALMDLGESYLLQDRKEEAKRILLEAEVIYDEQPLRREHIKLFQWLKMGSDDPLIYAERQIEEQARYMDDRVDELKEILKTLVIKNMLVAVEADKRRKEDTSFYRILAILSGLAAIVALMTWKIWWYRLRRGMEKELTKFMKN